MRCPFDGARRMVWPSSRISFVSFKAAISAVKIKEPAVAFGRLPQALKSKKVVQLLSEFASDANRKTPEIPSFRGFRLFLFLRNHNLNWKSSTLNPADFPMNGDTIPWR